MSKPIFTPHPIKYRVWTGKEMVVVQTLCFNEGGIIWYAAHPHMGYHCVWDSPMWNESNPKPNEGDLKPVMAWTGLLDKEGREIYEGDIVEVYLDMVDKRYRYQVVWDGKYVSFRPFASDFYWSDFEGGWDDKRISSETVNVIGNIYQNSELLKS